MPRALGLLVITSFGCGPLVLPGDGGGGGSSGAGEGPSTGATATTGATSSTPPPSTSTTVSDEGSEVDDDGILWDCGVGAPPGNRPRCTAPAPDVGGGEGESVCDPQPVPDVTAWVSFDLGSLPPEPFENPSSYACTIIGWQEAAGYVGIELSCADGGHSIELGTSTGIWFDTSGDFVVSVIYSDATFGGGDVLVTLRRADGELLVAGATTPWTPDHPSVPAGFFDPLDVTLLADVCPVEEPWGGDFLGPCFTVERQAIRFARDGRSVDVYDRGVDQLTPYVVSVQTAELRHDVTCTDTSDQWYSWLAAPTVPD